MAENDEDIKIAETEKEFRDDLTPGQLKSTFKNEQELEYHINNLKRYKKILYDARVKCDKVINHVVERLNHDKKCVNHLKALEDKFKSDECERQEKLKGWKLCRENSKDPKNKQYCEPEGWKLCKGDGADPNCYYELNLGRAWAATDKASKTAHNLSRAQQQCAPKARSPKPTLFPAPQPCGQDSGGHCLVYQCFEFHNAQCRPLNRHIPWLGGSCVCPGSMQGGAGWCD